MRVASRRGPNSLGRRQPLISCIPRCLLRFFLPSNATNLGTRTLQNIWVPSLIKKGNTSIGLGQVVVRTAEREDLFADLLSKTTRASLTHNDIAKLLASEEYNIFAVARYIRHVADAGAKISIATLPDTQATFPAIDMATYAGDSSTWPDDNIRALGSEYTSRPWDDVLVPRWADFVFEAYLEVIASGVF